MKKLVQNIFFVSFGELSSRVLSFITTIILIRVFSVEDFGNISIVTAIYGYAVLLSVHWLNPFGIKKISSGVSDDFLSRFTSIRFTLAFIALIIIFLITLFLNLQSDFKKLIFYFSLSLIPSAFFVDWYFQARENLKPVALSKFLLSAGYLLFLYLAIYFEKNITFVGLAFFGANVICSIYLITYYYFTIDKKLPTISLKKWSVILKESLPLSSATILSQLNVNLPFLLIGIFISAYDVGIFSAAYKLLFFLLLLDKFYYSIFFPAFTRIYSFQKELAEIFLNITLKITIILIIFISIICFIYTEEIITLIFGVKYINSVSVFQILLFYFILTIINSIFSFSLIAIGKEKYYLKVILSSIFLNIALLFMLINMYGVTGAALAIVLSDAFIMVTLLIYLKRFIVFQVKKYIFKMIALTIISSLIALYIKNYDIIFSLILSVLIYIFGIILFRILSKEELNLIKDKVWI